MLAKNHAAAWPGWQAEHMLLYNYTVSVVPEAAHSTCGPVLGAHARSAAGLRRNVLAPWCFLQTSSTTIETLTESMSTVRKSALDRVDKVQKEAEVREGSLHACMHARTNTSCDAHVQMRHAACAWGVG